jgi:hypothetical protein
MKDPFHILGAIMIIRQTVIVRYTNGVPFYDIITTRLPLK